MKPEVLVAIPTQGNRHNLRNVLTSLSNNEYSDFRACLIFKENPGRAIDFHEIIDEYSFEISVIKQQGKGFENAMNHIFSLPSDLIVTTDDDAILPQDHLEKVVSFFEDNPNCGLVSGNVNGKPPYQNKTLAAYLLNSYFGSSRPISLMAGQDTSTYVTYVNSIGLVSARVPVLLRQGKIAYFQSPIGVNMAWRGELSKDFRLLELTKRGILNETFLSLHILKKGYRTCYFALMNVAHKPVESLSNTNQICDLIFELYLSPIYLHLLRIQVDFDKILEFQRRLALPFIPYKKPISSAIQICRTALEQNWNLDITKRHVNIMYGSLLSQ